MSALAFWIKAVCVELCQLSANFICIFIHTHKHTQCESWYKMNHTMLTATQKTTPTVLNPRITERKLWRWRRRRRRPQRRWWCRWRRQQRRRRRRTNVIFIYIVDHHLHAIWQTINTVHKHKTQWERCIFIKTCNVIFFLALSLSRAVTCARCALIHSNTQCTMHLKQSQIKVHTHTHTIPCTHARTPPRTQHPFPKRWHALCM